MSKDLGGVTEEAVRACKNGHALVGHALYVRQTGGTGCRICRAEANARFRAKSADLPKKPRGKPFDYYVKKAGPDECWEWIGGHNDSGYGLYRCNKAHRIAFERVNGPIPDGLFVLHNCDNRPCVNPAHLRLGTNADNMADMVQRGRVHRPFGRWRGEACGGAKLSWEQVREIKRLRGTISTAELGRRFNVNRQTIGDIYKGRTWIETRPEAAASDQGQQP